MKNHMRSLKDQIRVGVNECILFGGLARNKQNPDQQSVVITDARTRAVFVLSCWHLGSFRSRTRFYVGCP